MPWRCPRLQEPEHVNPYCDVHTDIVLVADPVEERVVVRLPPAGATPATITKSTPVGDGEGRAHAPGKGISFSPGLRLRKRGSVTHHIESLANEFFMDRDACGGKTSDSTVRLYFDQIFGREVKVHGTHRVVIKNGNKDDPEVVDVYLLVERSDRYLTVSLRLLNKLLLASLFKARTQELLLSLKAKAMQYASELELSLSYQNMVLSGTLCLVMVTTKNEVNSFLSLGGVSGLARSEQGKQISKGQMPTVYIPGFKGLLRYYLFDKLPKEVVLPHAKT